MIRTIFILISCHVAVLAGLESLVQAEKVTIGVIAPMTGNAAHIGDEIQRTLSIVQEQFKEQKLINTYKFVIEDGKAAMDISPSTATKKLLEIHKAKFLISATSGETLQIAPIVKKERIVTIAVFSSHKDIKHLGKYIFRTFVDIERGIKTLAAEIKSRGITPIALLTEDHVFTQGVKSLLKENLKGQLAYVEDYPIDSSDVRTLLLKAKSSGARSMYFNCGHPKTCALIINQARQLGISIPIYSYLHMDNPEFLQATGENAEGIRFLAPPNIESSQRGFLDFLQKYKVSHGYTPKNDFLSRTTYDAAQVIVRAVESSGSDTENVLEFLRTYKGEGALGEISFDKNGDVRNINYVIKVIAQGRPHCESC